MPKSAKTWMCSRNAVSPPYDAVVFNNTTRLSLTPAQREALLAFVQAGKGLVGIHAASDSFYTWPEGQALLGGIFNSHPWTADDTSQSSSTIGTHR